MKNLSTKFGGAVLTLAFIFGLSAVAGLTAQAQDRDRYDRQDNRRDRDQRWNNNQNRDWRIERERALGRERAEEAARRARIYNNGRYNNGAYGTYGPYGNGNYGTYGNYGGYGSYGGYNQAAVNQGYQYGVNTGASDAQRGQSYDPQRSHYWRNASSLAFRQGFERGYAQGYRQYGGYGNGSYRRGGFGGIFGP